MERAAETKPHDAERKPIRVGLVLAAFPARRSTAFKYFLLLLNQLQRTFEFELFDTPLDDKFMAYLNSKIELNAETTRDELLGFASRLRKIVDSDIEEFDLAETYPSQLIIITLATLSDYHYLIRRKNVSLLALGEWDRSMAPPSAIEFLQIVVLRAAYSALEGGVWNTIHLGTRGCMFDFTVNLEDTRFMTLVGLGVCSECEAALQADGFVESANEIRTIVQRSWLGSRSVPGTPANLMARFGYDLFLTKGFTSTWRERLRQLLEEDAAKEFIKSIFYILVVGLLIWLNWKVK